jgi:hypothetical protein
LASHQFVQSSVCPVISLSFVFGGRASEKQRSRVVRWNTEQPAEKSILGRPVAKTPPALTISEGPRANTNTLGWQHGYVERQH